MGNHEAGRAMVATAVALSQHSDLEPLEILDIACEPWRGCDAEFDDAAWPGTPFGDLLGRAFPGPDMSDDSDGDLWYAHVYRPFRDRYHLI